MPLMNPESFGRTPPFHFRGKEIKSMKKIVLFSGICAVIYSVIKIKTIAQIWVLPAVFLGFCFLFSLFYWMFLGLFSLHIRLGKNYDKPSKVDYCLLNSGYKFLCSAARIKLHVTGIEKIPKEERFLLSVAAYLWVRIGKSVSTRTTSQGNKRFLLIDPCFFLKECPL